MKLVKCMCFGNLLSKLEGSRKPVSKSPVGTSAVIWVDKTKEMGTFVATGGRAI